MEKKENITRYFYSIPDRKGRPRITVCLIKALGNFGTSPEINYGPFTGVPLSGFRYFWCRGISICSLDDVLFRRAALRDQIPTFSVKYGRYLAYDRAYRALKLRKSSMPVRRPKSLQDYPISLLKGYDLYAAYVSGMLRKSDYDTALTTFEQAEVGEQELRREAKRLEKGNKALRRHRAENLIKMFRQQPIILTPSIGCLAPHSYVREEKELSLPVWWDGKEIIHLPPPDDALPIDIAHQETYSLPLNSQETGYQIGWERVWGNR